MRGTGAGYALYSEIIKQGKRSGVEWNGMSRLEHSSNWFYEKSGLKYLEIGM
jgi:hypothetical protein